MNAPAISCDSSLNPAAYQIGEAVARVSTAATVLKEDLVQPLARFLARTNRLFEQGKRETLQALRQQDAAPRCLTAISFPPPPPPPPLDAEEVPLPRARPTTMGPVAPASPAERPQERRGAARGSEHGHARRRPRPRRARRHRARAPVAIAAAVVEQLFRVKRRTLRRCVADGSLTDLRHPGRAQNTPLLLDIRQVAKRWPRRKEVELTIEHWALRLIDEEIFFPQRPDISRHGPAMRT